MKIYTLKILEINNIKDKILAKYAPVHFRIYSETFVPNAYKPNYAGLAKEIEDFLKQKFGNNANYDDKAYVSTGLLRKLFYESKNKEEETFSSAFINACYWYITDGEMDRLSYLKSQILEEKTQKGPDRYVKIIALSGALAGCISSITTLSLPFFNGYDGTPARELYPLIFFVQVSIGWIAGWLCGDYALNYTHRNDWGVLARLFMGSFVGFAIMRQVAVRNALVLPGKGPLGSGPFGTPDMETIATAFSCALGLVYCALFLRQARVPTFKTSIIVSIQISLIAGISFAFIYLVYRILLNNGLVAEGYYFISPAVFSFKFPHPERIYLTSIIAALYTLTIFNFLRWTYKP